MAHLNLVATELANKGFETSLFNNSVIVSLSNRKPARMEVETALMQSFKNIDFELQSTNNAVVVSL